MQLVGTGVGVGATGVGVTGVGVGATGVGVGATGVGVTGVGAIGVGAIGVGVGMLATTNTISPGFPPEGVDEDVVKETAILAIVPSDCVVKKYDGTEDKVLVEFNIVVPFNVVLFNLALSITLRDETSNDSL